MVSLCTRLFLAGNEAPPVVVLVSAMRVRVGLGVLVVEVAGTPGSTRLGLENPMEESLREYQKYVRIIINSILNLMPKIMHDMLNLQ